MLTLKTCFCSDPIAGRQIQKFEDLVEYWSGLSDVNVEATALADRPTTAREKVDALVDALEDPRAPFVADATGGEGTFEILPALVERLASFEAAENPSTYWSMSDNCLVLNVLLDRVPVRLLHGQPFTLVGKDQDEQRFRFESSLSALSKGLPFPSELLPPIRVVRGRLPTAPIFGGNLRTLAQLVETPWFPSANGRVLLVEAWSPNLDRARSLWKAVVDSGKIDGVNGILYGKMSALEKANESNAFLEEILATIAPSVPIGRTSSVGHGAECWTIPFGEPLTWSLIDA